LKKIQRKMEALYKLNVNEIDNSFLESIKRLFKGKKVIISITSFEDETTYLSSFEANKMHILNNIVAEPTARFSGDDFLKYTSQE